MPKPSVIESLSRRERQIMDVLFRMEKATAREIQSEMPDPPSYSAVRAMLAILLEKEVIKHEKQGRQFVYQPTVTRPKAKRQALRTLLRTFFDDSPEKLVASLLDPKDQNLTDEEIERIRRLVDES
ncbi:MAG: BlaI/MecI/CopY family transcriptional regulator [Verrucomicrobiae bacterium]|nr:BlaI/MecI/CopY family transcriptional regulator [Verrucomicrobiae bacterium]